MNWLVLSILCSTAIFIIFKFYERFGINNLTAIVVNYLTAGLVGVIIEGEAISPIYVMQQNWFSSIIILGFLFIILFQVMAFVAQKIGVSVVSVAVKMSLVIPVAFAMVYFREPINFIQGLGILLALPAVYLSSRKDEKIKMNPSFAWLPLILFIGSGFLDSFLKYNQEILVDAGEHGLFTTSLFGMAGLFGILLILIQILRKSFSFRGKDIIAGLILGIPNYGSIYFLLRALDFQDLQSSVIFPLNNVGIVVLSVISGVVIFREKLSQRNIIGIILALTAIVLVSIENISNV